MVARHLLLMALLEMKLVAHFTEQPASSLMPMHPLYRAFFRFFKWNTVQTWMGMFGGPSAKPHKIFSNVKYVQDLHRTLDRKVLKKKKSQMVIRRKVKGALQVSGGRDLKSSQEYTVAFGKAVADMYEQVGNHNHACVTWVRT